MSALQVVAAQDLRGAAELEIAVSRAVSLGNATLADVRLSQDFEDPNAMSSDSSMSQEVRPSKKTLIGFEAIRSLHMGSAARAFYGTQTVPTRRLADPSLSIIKVSLGSTGLDSFAWNLMCMKLAGLQPDPNLVIILDGAENMRIRNRRFMKHDSFSERLLKNLKKRGPLVLTLEHPSDMAPGAIGVLVSCVSLRIRESVDIKIISDHIRAIVVAICDGVNPSNEDRGYVVRKLIRIGVNNCRALGVDKPLLYKIIPSFVDTMKDPYPELLDRRENIAEIVKREEESCYKILQNQIPAFEN